MPGLLRLLPIGVDGLRLDALDRDRLPALGRVLTPRLLEALAAAG